MSYACKVQYYYDVKMSIEFIYATTDGVANACFMLIVY